MERIHRARKLLERRGHRELAELLKDCQLDVGIDPFGDVDGSAIRAPVAVYEQLLEIKRPAYDALLSALREVRAKNEPEFSELKFELDPQSLVGDALSDAELLKELETERMMMVSVSTGRGPQINEVNDEYGQRREHIKAALRARGILDPNPFADLWAWYSRWSSGDYKTYQSRRGVVHSSSRARETARRRRACQYIR